MQRQQSSGDASSEFLVQCVMPQRESQPGLGQGQTAFHCVARCTPLSLPTALPTGDDSALVTVLVPIDATTS